MENSFFRFPHTPHLTWLGQDSARGDKVLDEHAVSDLLSGAVLVEEKLDGANIGLSLGKDGQVQVQNRGQYLTEPYRGQFSRLTSWLGQHRYTLTDHLQDNWILFGEWCAARHSLAYNRLLDWFMLFDVYDRSEQKFWSSGRRNRLAEQLGLATVPLIFQKQMRLEELIQQLNSGSSRCRSGAPEGFVIRRDSSQWCEARAKLVRAEFTQVIDQHWRSRAIEWNCIQEQG